jgi:hypothetical protein
MLEKIHLVFYVNLLQHALNNTLLLQRIRDTQPGPILADREEVWLVERILDKRTTKQGRKAFKEVHVK